MLGGELLARFRAFIFNIIWPAHCLICGQTNSWCCPTCRNQITKDWQWRQLTNQTFFCANYRDYPLNQLIKQAKYGKTKITIELLAECFADFATINLQKLNLGSTTITAVPLSRARLNWRGFNQSAILAKKLAASLDLPFIDHWQRRKASNQSSLSRQARLKNLVSVFTWETKLSGTIILVDDIVTTGQTLSQASYCLKRAGAQKIIKLALAH
ncbi:MAG TPA: phosphoribosyltransferase family protein [bacterium]|nr:phosphoribosyltransferase family protein [bacterium]